MRYNRSLLSCLLFCLVGCGGAAVENTLEVYPVSGMVLVDGKALPAVSVTFFPEKATKGNGGFGATDESGNFTLKDRDQREGVSEGTYRVLFTRLVKPDGSPIGNDQMAADVGAVNQLPEIYNDLSQSPVTATVGKTNEPFKFELKSK
ncbi:carboxypeptidase regulatory-like domain-containing protein [uncultured Gimesia sp.]|uniref:carboxypeptidase regulatory-like domain-containing protein n=1 Tax=uncultured Gimesia sp. TaxID=1678688 RepID=UPI0030D72230